MKIILATILFCTLAAPRQPAAGGNTVQIQIKNVNLLLQRDIILEVRELRGTLEKTHTGTPVTFDDITSYMADIDSAKVAISPASLTALMNSYVFAYQGAPVKNITMRIEGDRLVQTGTIHKGVDLPFEIEATPSATPDGNIRMHADKIKAAHVPVKGLLHFLGEDLSKLLKQKAGHGLTVDGDDIILSPEWLTPPPQLKGRITRVAIEDGKVIEEFNSGKPQRPLKPPFPTGAYLYHRGGVLRFGKLTMRDADLEIVGDRPGSFNFFQREYKKQLVAGYSKNTGSNGLIAHMVDYSHFLGTQ